MGEGYPITTQTLQSFTQRHFRSVRICSTNVNWRNSKDV